MALEIVVPEVSDGVTSGTVISVAVKAGDEVEADQTLLELETDKAVVAIPSPAAGKIKEVRVAEGDSVDVGAVIMLLETSEAASVEEESTETKEEKTPEVPAPEDVIKESPPSPQLQAAGSGAPAIEAAETLDLQSVRKGGQVAPAAPSVRRLARDLGVDIYRVQGSGPGGRISPDDVRAFVRSTMQSLNGGQIPSALAGYSEQRPLPDFSQWGPVSRQPLSRVREVTAEAMSYAWSTIPMVTQYDQMDATDMEAFRKKYNSEEDIENKLTLTAILVKVCAAALKKFPQFNSSLDSAAKELILKDYIHIGVAVDTPNGLLVPVIRDADQKAIQLLAAELNELAARTRERKIKPAELEGGSFTISNLGGIGGTAFTPIVYAPQVAILGVSRAEMKPVWDGQEFLPRQVVTLSLSYDHRVIDGADGARFLRWICEAVENPLRLII